MKWKYTLLELKKYKRILLFVALQTIIVYIVVISSVSVISSRYKKYNAIKDLVAGNGQIMNVIHVNETNNTDCIMAREALEKCLQDTEVSGCYDWMFEDENGDTIAKMTGYDDAIWKAYSPKLDSGRWFSDEDKSSETLEVVIAQKDGKNGRYQAGDIIAADMGFSGECSIDPDKGNITLKVIGIIANGSSILEKTTGEEETSDYRKLFVDYYDYYANGISIYGIQSDLYRFKMQYARSWFTKMGGYCFIKWNTEDTEVISSNQEYLSSHGLYSSETDFDTMRKYSRQYIYEQLKYIIPVLIPLLILTILSTACNMAIIAQKSLRDFAVYYINGFSWKMCRRLCFRSNLVLQMGSLLITLIGLIVSVTLQVTEKSVISIGIPQVGICMILGLMFSMIGILVTYMELKDVTINAVLREADQN